MSKIYQVREEHLKLVTPDEPVTPGNPETPPVVTLPEGYLSPNFRRAEFTCNHCGKLPQDPPHKLLEWLENIRAHFGNRAVNINSGYRCPIHNANVQGATNSRHLIPDAADFWINGVSNSDVQEYAETVVGDEGGLGIYPNFTHIDTRGYRARW